MTTVVASLAGCIEDYGDYSGHQDEYVDYRDHSSHASYADSEPEESDEECDLPEGQDEPRDPLHIRESRDVHGYEFKRWSWWLGACRIIQYNVSLEMGGTTSHADAVAMSVRVFLEDPEGRSIVEQQDTVSLSESQTMLNWTLKPGAPVIPGEWTLGFSAAGDYHYEAKVDLEY